MFQNKKKNRCTKLWRLIQNTVGILPSCVCPYLIGMGLEVSSNSGSPPWIPGSVGDVSVPPPHHISYHSLKGWQTFSKQTLKSFQYMKKSNTYLTKKNQLSWTVQTFQSMLKSHRLLNWSKSIFSLSNRTYLL